MAGSRPDTYTQAVADYICDQVVSGRTLLAVLNDPGMPDRVTVWRWRKSHPVFDQTLTAARAAGMEYVVDEVREIADDGTNDWMEKHGRDGEAIGWQVNGEALARSKLRIETRFREAEALAPKVYGKRQAIEHSGTVGVVLATTSDDELMAEMLALLATGRLKLPEGIELEEAEDEDDVTPEEDEDDYSDIA